SLRSPPARRSSTLRVEEKKKQQDNFWTASANRKDGYNLLPINQSTNQPVNQLPMQKLRSIKSPEKIFWKSFKVSMLPARMGAEKTTE
ncbi:MAG: hypothetical protein JW849_06535, partial [Phycisphaerae bacterium]|nr:hypothetical protein [Phycisphaerae bacterium]